MKFLKLSSFTILSGIGWCIDFAIFNYLVALGHPYLASNVISASVGVTFVFATARRWIFKNHVGSLQGAVLQYVIWNIVAITAASFVLKIIAAGLSHLDMNSISQIISATIGIRIPERALISNAAKILVTPFTMYANFVAMGYIIERRFSFV